MVRERGDGGVEGLETRIINVTTKRDGGNQARVDKKIKGKRQAGRKMERKEEAERERNE